MGFGTDMLEDMLLEEMVQDLYVEDMLGRGQWTTEAGKVMKISAMTNDHLRNTCVLLQKSDWLYAEDFRRKMLAELRRRWAPLKLREVRISKRR